MLAKLPADRSEQDDSRARQNAWHGNPPSYGLWRNSHTCALSQ
jgi:hypothetical protein